MRGIALLSNDSFNSKCWVHHSLSWKSQALLLELLCTNHWLSAISQSHLLFLCRLHSWSFSKIEIYQEKYPTQNNYNQENEEPSGVWIFLKDAGKWKRTEKLLILYTWINVIRKISILAHLPIINSKSREIILGVRTTWEINFSRSSSTASQFLAPLSFQMYMPETTVILEFLLSLQPTFNPLRGYAFIIDPISDHA